MTYYEVIKKRYLCFITVTNTLIFMGQRGKS